MKKYLRMGNIILILAVIPITITSCGIKNKSFVNNDKINIPLSEQILINNEFISDNNFEYIDLSDIYVQFEEDIIFNNFSESNDIIFNDNKSVLGENLSLYSSAIEQNYQGTEPDMFYEMKEFNIPIVMTPIVKKYINYFTKRVPATTQKWLDRANKYIYIVEDIFLEAGIPSDLIALAFAESGYNNHAISRAGATGMWQFMPSTGKMYGMKNNFWVDERRDFELSSAAASRYLTDLHNRFDDWFLALAAYNAGPGRISRASRKHKTDDYFIIASKRTLAIETRQYVPKFIALLIIYKNYLKFGFEPPKSAPLMFTSISLNSQLNLYWLADQLDVDIIVLTELNPSLKLPITPPVQGYKVRVPYNMKEKALVAIKNSTQDERLLYKIYYARSGDTINKIAKKNSVTVEKLRNINGMLDNMIYQNKPIFIPIEGLTDDKANKQLSYTLSKLARKYYIVRQGDTFIGIAYKHGMNSNILRRLNPNINVHKLRINQRIVVDRGVINIRNTNSRGKKSNISNVNTIGKIAHRVQKGESLYSISRKYNVKIDNIKKQNSLQDNVINAGIILYITR